MSSFNRFRFPILLMVAFDCLSIPAAFATGGGEGGSSPATVIGLQGSSGAEGLSASSSGIIANDVNLFTGGVGFVFPLFSVQGRAGLDLSVGLQYSSHVMQSSNAPNWESQASWVGLGWTLTYGSIIAEHKGTRFYSDDEYILVSEDGSAHKLVQSAPGSNVFYLQDYRYWKITRIVDAFHVRGWEIKHEDATIFVYGDTTDNTFGHTVANRNATRYRICWGDFSGLGSSFGGGVDSVFAYQWDLSRVSTMTREQSIVFSYDQDTVYLNNGTASSARPYTKASYLRRVTLPNGRYVTFTRQARGDTATLHSDRVWQNSHQRERLQYIDSYTRAGELVQRATLAYSSQGSTHPKSMLTSITLSDGAGAALPAYGFSYRQADPNAFALQSITYPIGGKTEYEYAEVDRTLGGSNFARLDAQAGFFGGGDFFGHAWGDEAICAAGFSNYQKVSSQLSPLDSLNGDRRFVVMSWNGYWQRRHFDWHIDADTAEDDLDVVDGDASPDLFAFFNEQTRTIMAYSQIGGEWDSTALKVLTTYNALTEFVWVMVGPDYVAAIVSAKDSLYIWNRDNSTASGWSTPSQTYAGGGTWYDHETYVTKGKRQVNWAYPLAHTAHPGSFSLFYEKSSGRYARAAHWTGTSWDWVNLPANPGTVKRRWASGKDFMLVAEVDSYVAGGTRLYQCRWDRGSWHIDSSDVSGKKYWVPHVGPDFVLFRYQAGASSDWLLNSYKWNGSSWQTQDFGQLSDFNCLDSVALVSVRRDGFIASARLDTAAGGQYNHFVRAYEWSGTSWVPVDTLLNQQESAKKYLVSSGPDCALVFKWAEDDMWAHARSSSGWSSGTYFDRIRTIASGGAGRSFVSIADSSESSAEEGRFYYFNGTSWSDSGVVGNEDYVGQFLPSVALTQTSINAASFVKTTIAAWKWHTGAFRYKAKYFMLSKRKVFDGIHISGSDTTWDMTSYEYSGGILDETSSYPRFHKSTVRGPYRGASPDSKDYTTTWFYNDVDAAVDATFPDLDQGDGYLKDGVAYYVVSGNATSGIDSNWAKTEVTVVHPKVGTYAVRTDRAISVTDGVADTVEYTYESPPGAARDNGLPQCVRRFGSRIGTGGTYSREIQYDSTVDLPPKNWTKLSWSN